MPKLKFFPHCTEYPPQYWCYPPLYWCYPHICWCYPSNVLNTLHSCEAIPHCTDVIPHCTEQPPQYWRYPHSTEAIPHMYCCYPLTVLKVSLHSTEYPPQYWCYPPQYWTTSTVLKLFPNVLSNLHSTKAIPHSTEPTLYRVLTHQIILLPQVV